MRKERTTAGELRGTGEEHRPRTTGSERDTVLVAVTSHNLGPVETDVDFSKESGRHLIGAVNSGVRGRRTGKARHGKIEVTKKGSNNRERRGPVHNAYLEGISKENRGPYLNYAKGRGAKHRGALQRLSRTEKRRIRRL